MHPHARLHSTHCFTRAFSIVPLLAVFLLLSFSLAQEATAKRKIVTKATATYPALAWHMALSGVVKIDVVVAPDGTVKTLDIKGGHPVLAQAASNSIRQWKWEPAARESHELVEVRFSPPE